MAESTQTLIDRQPTNGRNLINPRVKKFFSYYRPYKRLLFADLACAFIVSAVTVVLPLCAGYITKNVLDSHNPNALNQIYAMSAVMVVLVAIHAVCNAFVDYQGHVMG